MKNILGSRISEFRESLEVTQNEFADKYGVSGPAIFKFERGYVRPSLELWLSMARDFGLSDRRAVLLWAKSKLPDKFQRYVDLAAGALSSKDSKDGHGVHGLDYAEFKDREAMREAACKDDTVPRGLKALLRNNDDWALLKPTGEEIAFLRDVFGNLGEGTIENFREALRLIRQFAKKTK